MDSGEGRNQRSQKQRPPKKRVDRRKSRTGEDVGHSENWDAGSSVSASTMASLKEFDAVEPEEVEDDPWERHIDALYEKRATTRERALGGVANLLALTCSLDNVDRRKEMLTGLLIRSVRYGGSVEACLAARCLGLLSITLGAGDDSERLLQEGRSLLETASVSGKTPSVKAAAGEALAVLAFVGSEHPSDTLEVAQHLQSLWKGPTGAMVAALRGWSLLVSTLPTYSLSTDFVETSFAVLAALLYSENVDTRAAAGEAIALLYDSAGLAQLEGDSGDSGEEDISDYPARADAGAKRSAGMEDVVARMKQLATNRGDAKRRSKKDRSSLKSTFRDLCSTLEDGQVAETKVKLRAGDTLVIDTVAGNVQLNALRRFLNEGFQAHLQNNELLHQVFDFRPLQGRADKSQLTHSDAAASRSRLKSRSAVAAYKGAMMAVED